MSRTSVILSVWLVLLTLVIGWAHTIELFYLSGIRQVLDVFWGRIVLVDFVASLVLIGVWIAMLHPPGQRLSRGIPWTLGVVILGTPVALVFFLLRARTRSTAQDIFLGAPEGPEPSSASTSLGG